MVVGREIASLVRAKRLRDILVGELRFDSSDGVQEHTEEGQLAWGRFLRLRRWSFSWAAGGSSLQHSTDFDTKRHDGASPRGETMSQYFQGKC
jgi:hypothetical protein